jgi:hypothetical protein
MFSMLVRIKAVDDTLALGVPAARRPRLGRDEHQRQERARRDASLGPGRAGVSRRCWPADHPRATWGSFDQYHSVKPTPPRRDPYPEKERLQSRGAELDAYGVNAPAPPLPVLVEP